MPKTTKGECVFTAVKYAGNPYDNIWTVPGIYRDKKQFSIRTYNRTVKADGLNLVVTAVVVRRKPARDN